MSEYEKVRDRWIEQEGHTPQCRICGGYAREPELCRCSVEGAILLDLIAELVGDDGDGHAITADGDDACRVCQMIDRAEARLREVQS